MMSAGPWKPIHLEIYQSRIEEIHFPVNISDDLSSAKIDYTIKVESPSPEITVCVTLIPPDDSSPVYSENLSINSSKVEGSISIDNPILWYPLGYGAQSRYQLIVKLHANNKVLDTQTRHLGLRVARVIQEPLNSEPGTTFYFSINNIPIFCGGSNWIPADNILTHLTPDKYHKWLSLAVKGNQNMIRVWGGGIYEHEAFYDAADELGLLVWQDFCFACGQYPAHKEFRESVKKEAEVQCKRLRWHPSVVLFAGNNEDYQVAESASLGWDPSEKDPEKWLKSNFPARYIYEKLLPEVVSEQAPGVFYHPGSPWGGGKPTTDNSVGDIHQWNSITLFRPC
jgi:beta-mannosidase